MSSARIWAVLHSRNSLHILMHIIYPPQSLLVFDYSINCELFFFYINAPNVVFYQTDNKLSHTHIGTPITAQVNPWQGNCRNYNTPWRQATQTWPRCTAYVVDISWNQHTMSPHAGWRRRDHRLVAERRPRDNMCHFWRMSCFDVSAVRCRSAYLR